MSSGSGFEASIPTESPGAKHMWKPTSINTAKAAEGYGAPPGARGGFNTQPDYTNTGESMDTMKAPSSTIGGGADAGSSGQDPGSSDQSGNLNLADASPEDVKKGMTAGAGAVADAMKTLAGSAADTTKDMLKR